MSRKETKQTIEEKNEIQLALDLLNAYCDDLEAGRPRTAEDIRLGLHVLHILFENSAVSEAISKKGAGNGTEYGPEYGLMKARSAVDDYERDREKRLHLHSRLKGGIAEVHSLMKNHDHAKAGCSNSNAEESRPAGKLDAARAMLAHLWKARGPGAA